MTKTIASALFDEVYYPIPQGKIENILIARGLDGDAYFTPEVTKSAAYKGALADCYYSLIVSVSYSEADKSVSGLTDKDKDRILAMARKLYGEIGEEMEDLPGLPAVYFGG